jgi:hypothetical protein
MSSLTGLRVYWRRKRCERAVVDPVLLDSSFLIDLEREIEAGLARTTLGS